MDSTDLYAVLGLERNASREDIRKAYRKLALLHHPDKVAESERAEADITFKRISEAYDILYDEDKKELYDRHGMAAFDSSNSMPGAAADMEDILAEFLGMNTGSRSRRPRRSADETQAYEISLEDLYKGKAVKFSCIKNVICSHCAGKGGKKNSKSRQCPACKGEGIKRAFARQGQFLSQNIIECDSCHGGGEVYDDKDKCKKCKGKRTLAEKKFLELYIPPGSKEGDRIILQGEADQSPGQEPGDIIFVLKQKEHETFERQGSDLKARLNLTLAEALCGLRRPIIRTLDGRALSIDHRKPVKGVLRPGQVIRIPSEGMPVKKSDLKGDLYLEVNIEFPDDDFMQDEKITSALQKILPKPRPIIKGSEIEDVNHETLESDEAFGGSGPFGDEEWEDEGDLPTAQCAQQ